MIEGESTLLAALCCLAQENEILGPEDLQAIVAEAKSGCASAQFIVGSALERSGDRVHADDWYRRSAEQKFPPAVAKLNESNEAA